MKPEIIETVPQRTETAQYLNLEVSSREELRTAYSFFYIGNNPHSIDSLSDYFESGFTAESFSGVKKIMQSSKYKLQPADVIIIDIPFDGVELTAFQAFLKKDQQYQHMPVIYNGKHLLNKSMAFQFELIDDVIDMNNLPLNFWGKISFLQKVKKHQKQSGYSSRMLAKAVLQQSNHFCKRFFDVFVASLLILILSPLFLLIALVIRFESKGPIFYNAKRAGRGFKIFKFYKFRTMVVNADKKISELAHLNQYGADAPSGPKFFKISNDPRITRVGRFLRNSSLDELPQLFNVLKGDMSLVGNRPLPLYEAATLTTNEYVERFAAPAGITGLWQIKKRGKSEMSVEERISLDISYARKSNLLYDLWIMANTPGALLQKSDV